MRNNVLEKKETFFYRKNKHFWQSHISHFSKGLTHAFGQKMQFFSLFVFAAKIRLQIRFNNVLDRKETFFDCKKDIFQNLKNCIFPKGLTHAFGQKCQFFYFLFSLKIRLEIRFKNVPDRKETFFEYKNKTLQSPKKLHFSKRVNPCFWSKNAKFFFI